MVVFHMKSEMELWERRWTLLTNSRTICLVSPMPINLLVADNNIFIWQQIEISECRIVFCFLILMLSLSSWCTVRCDPEIYMYQALSTTLDCNMF